MEFGLSIVQLLTWIGKLLKWFKWFISPSVIPAAGAVAAVIAALTVEPQTWLKSPMKSFGRGLRVAALWLVVAWMLTFAAGLGSGEGKGGRDGSGNSKPNGGTSVPPSVTKGPGQLPPEHADADLVIKFIASKKDPSQAQEFSCVLIQKTAEKKATQFEIRAGNMRDFNKLLEEQLRNMNLPQPQPNILIKRSPFPGENTLRQVSNKVREVFPNANVNVIEE